MNRLRILMERDGVIRRCLLLLVFTVLLSRAFLSSAVMLDPLAPAGSFGLVMCSGQGPLFRDGTRVPDAGAAAAMAGMRMDGDMAGMADMPHGSGRAAPADAGNDDGMTGTAADNGACPFSAAFAVAIAGLACAVLLFLLTVSRRQAWRTWRMHVRARVNAYALPAARAPPLA